MNTQQRLFLLNKFSRHLQQKVRKIQKQKQSFVKNIQNHDIDFNSLPKIDIIVDLSLYHKDIDKTINQTYTSISSVMQNLTKLKNRKQNTQTLNDILSSISMVKELSISLKIDDLPSHAELCKTLAAFYDVKFKARYCDRYIKEIQEQIVKIQAKYKKQFDEELTKKNSANIKDLAKVLQLIKVNKNKSSQSLGGQNKSNKQLQGINKQVSQNKQSEKGTPIMKQGKGETSSESLSQITQFYVNMVKKQLQKYQDDLFNIPIVSSNPNELSYIFFDIIKNCLKSINTIISTYHTNIIQLQNVQGLHNIIITIFRYSMCNLIYQILVRQKKYYQIDKIAISRNKLTIKSSQYKILKNYFKQFNAIWNQIQRFKLHLYEYVDKIENYKQEKKMKFNKELNDIINGEKFVDFNYEIILYFQAFFRHQLDRLLKKSPFIVSLWQLEDQFFKDVRQKNQYKSNLSGQDFIEQMILKFSEGIKKSFQTLNILIVSALINFVNHNLIYEDSFYGFNQLMNKFLNKISSQAKSIQGIVILLNTVSTYPKAVKSSFQQLQIPQQLPQQRIKNEISQLIHNCKQKTGQFIVQSFDKILAQDFILQKMYNNQSNSYQQIVTKLFLNFQKDLLELFVYKMSKIHVDIILQRQFKQKYSHMQVLALEKEVRNIINFYESRSHSIRQNFRKILDYIEVLLVESQGSLKKLIEEWKGKYDQATLREIWKLRTQ